jgi:DNA-binding response OmpR family regulator
MQDANTERRKPSRVLIVETDEARAREFVQALNSVARLSAQVVSGKLATFERLKSWNPHLILIGDELNGHCGLELTIWIRKYSNVPIMVVTEDDSFEYYLQILNSGADGCVYYPIPAPLLSAQLLSLMRRAYRYSHIVERKIDEKTNQAPKGGFRSTTNTPPLAAASTPAASGAAAIANAAVWPTCGVCSYKGPAEKFQTIMPSGEVAMRCPACSSSHQLRYSID